MSEVLITFDKKNPGIRMDEINIKAIIEDIDDKLELEYKFLEGWEGLWKPIRDFSHQNACLWRPEIEGKYMIMVQAREKKSNKPYSYLGRVEYEVMDMENKGMIEDVIINKKNFSIGEKVNIEVKSSSKGLLYRFWIKNKNEWEQISDYSSKNSVTYTACNIGKQEILVECKFIDSRNNVDGFKTIKFDVKEEGCIEITNFDCISEKILACEDLEFKVKTNYDGKRTILYKFLKVDKNGKVNCVQDYSTRNTVILKEQAGGENTLLCLVRDILSSKPYDDRAKISYEVKLYEDITIKKFTCDMNSPQIQGTKVNFSVVVEGGRDLLYKYIVEGPISEETGYIRSECFEWNTKVEGEYKITVKVRDLSYDGDYEDKNTLCFNVRKKGSKPVKIQEVCATKTRDCIIGEPINIKVKAEGGTEIRYCFIILKGGQEITRSLYSKNNWINFTPEENGEYEIEVRAVDKYSSKDYDSHTFIYLKVRSYIPAKIDYVLTKSKETYLVGDKIELEVIVNDNKINLLKYITKINGHEVENTGYINSRRLRVKPKCAGKYTFEICAKNVECSDEYDSKKEISVYVHEAIPIRNTKIKIKNKNTRVNEDITFQVSSIGGKEVCYEFFIMEKDNWYRVQEYSRKNYYTFLPFSKGKYRVLVFAKSYHKRCNYEDYNSLEFEVV